MATQYMKDKPTAEDFAYAYAETADGALVRVPKSKVTGEGVTVDSALSETSTNPVQNKVVAEKFNELSEEKVSLPKDENGNLLTPQAGQTLLFNSDGTTYYGTPTDGDDSGGDSSATDTTPVIAYEGYVMGDTTGGMSKLSGYGVTEFYSTPEPVTGSVGFTIVYKTPAITQISATPRYQLWNDNSYVTYWSQAIVDSDVETMMEQFLDSKYGDFNKIRMNIVLDSIDDSCAYWKETGDVLFAGKNTQYYGMSNINGTAEMTSALSVDRDYAQDYGVSTLSLVTNNASSTETGINSTYASVIEKAKNAWLTETNGNIDKIPLIVHTDQHGNYSKSLFDFIGEIIDWYDIGKVINLGDTVDSWGDAGNLISCTNLENYVKSMESIPYSKRIEVFGNHDANGESDGTTVGMTPNNHLYKYFRNICARRADNYGNFTVKDDNFNVKYVVISGFAFDSEVGGYSHYIIPPDSIDLIIEELEKQDGYDVIILSHAPLGADVMPTDPTTGENAAYNPSGANAVSWKLLTDLWSGRKSKTSGNVTDEYNITHEFDFTNCDGELLCGLHGHMHEDSYYYIGELLDVCFDAYYISPNAIHFVLVDRENRRLNVWKVDSTPQYQNYQIPFDKTTD